MKEIVLPEIVAVGIYHSKIAAKNKTITKNRKTTMFEIEIPVEKGGVSYIDYEQMPISPNMVICAKPGQIRHTKLPFKCYYLHVILKEGTLYDILMNTPNYILTNRFSVYQKIFRELCAYSNTFSETDTVMLHSLILQLIYTMNRDAKRLPFGKKREKRSEEMVEKALLYIGKNLSSDLSLKTVAEQVSFSPTYFHNAFKLATTKTLREYVEEQRIKASIELLTTTDLTLAEIAYRCGFSSQAYFSCVFKRKMQITPREYAREYYQRYAT